MCKGNKSSNRQSGFTLVELAIVLVIVGLILGAVLKGQQMIENAKVKSVANDLKGVVTAYYAYQDRYKAIPGDDKLASTHVSALQRQPLLSMVTETGLSLVRLKRQQYLTATTESNNFWQHVRLSGFITGSGSDPATNSVGAVAGCAERSNRDGNLWHDWQCSLCQCCPAENRTGG